MADLKSKLLPSTSGHYYTKIKGMQAQAVSKRLFTNFLHVDLVIDKWKSGRAQSNRLSVITKIHEMKVQLRGNLQQMKIVLCSSVKKKINSYRPMKFVKVHEG